MESVKQERILTEESGIGPYDAVSALDKAFRVRWLRRKGSRAGRRDLAARSDAAYSRGLATLAGRCGRIIARLVKASGGRCKAAAEACKALYFDVGRLALDKGDETDDTPLSAPVKSAREAVMTLKTTIARKAEELFEARDEATSLKHFFQQIHPIDPPGRAPQDSASPLTDVALIIVFALIEIGMNGFFFLEAGEFGVLEAMFKVVYFAPVNVGTAALIGLIGFRYIRHVEWTKRLGAGVLLAVLIPFLLLFNLYMAAVRLAFSDIGYTAGQIFQLLLSKNAMDIVDPPTVGTFFVGLFLALAAGWKGYRIFDPYPGYGRVYRQWQHAQEKYQKVKKEYSKGLEDIENEAIKALETIRHGAIADVTKFHDLLSASKYEAESFEISRLRIREQYAWAVDEFSSAYVPVRLNIANGLLPASPELKIDIDLTAIEQDSARAGRMMVMLEKIDQNAQHYMATVKTYVAQQHKGINPFFKEIEDIVKRHSFEAIPIREATGAASE